MRKTNNAVRHNVSPGTNPACHFWMIYEGLEIGVFRHFGCGYNGAVRGVSSRNGFVGVADYNLPNHALHAVCAKYDICTKCLPRLQSHLAEIRVQRDDPAVQEKGHVRRGEFEEHVE
jgi:hypothetical protein